jgi:UV excision repair protein RAD23
MSGGPQAAQIMAALTQMPPEQQAQMAAQLGMNPHQLDELLQMVGQMPPQQLQQMMAQGGMGGMGGQGEPPPPGTSQLTQEEADAVERLASMGFDKSEAVQAFLACDKNEMLAANLLMDGGFEGGDMDFQEAGGAPDGAGVGDANVGDQA